MEISEGEIRGRFLAPTPEEEVQRLQRQRIDDGLRWEGYANESDAQFVGIVNHATAANRCTAVARGDR